MVQSSSADDRRPGGQIMPSGWYELHSEQRRAIRVRAALGLARRGLAGTLLYPILNGLYFVVTPSATKLPAATWALSIALTLAAVVRIALIVTAKRAVPRRLNTWRRAYGTATVTMGGLWSLLVCLSLLAGGLSWGPMMMFLATSAFGAGGLTTLAGERLMTWGHISATLLPLAAIGFWIPEEGGNALAVMMLFYWAYTVAQAQRVTKDHWELLFAPASVRQLIDRNPGGVAVVRDGKLAYINPTWARALSLQPDQLVGQQLEGLVDEQSGEVEGGLLSLTTRFGHKRLFDVQPGQTIQFAGQRGTLVVARDVTSQRDLVSAVRQTSDAVVAAAGEIGEMASQQQDGSDEQAAAVYEARATLEALATASSQIAESAAAVANAVERTLDHNQAIAHRTQELTRHSHRIDEVLELTREVAARSEVLALNAALEGIRAGEAGRGFSLVADQMQQMAESIAVSVGDVRSITENIQLATQAALEATDEGSRVAEAASQAAHRIGQLAEEQRQHTDRATGAMDRVAGVAAQIADGGTRTQGASEALAATAARLKKRLEQFKL